MAPMTATHSLPLLMRPAGFLLPALAALALASCAAPPPPPSPPPTASVPPPAPQQQAPPPLPPPPPAAPAAQSQAPFVTPGEMDLARPGSLPPPARIATPSQSKPAPDTVQEATSPMSEQEFIALSSKIASRREGLAVGVCGWSPRERSYGIQAGGIRDPLGVTVYNRDSEEWRKCVDREMSTKHKKEEKEMAEEVINAARRSGMLPNR